MNPLEKLSFSLRTFSSSIVQQAISHAIFRDLTDRRFAEVHIGEPVQPGRLLSGEAQARGGSFRFEQATLEIDFLEPGLARVSWGPAQEPGEIAIQPVEWPDLEVSARQDGEDWELSSGELTVSIRPTGALIWKDRQGDLIRSEQAPERYVFAEETAGWAQRAGLATEEHIYGLGEQAGPLNLRGAFHRIWNTDPGGSYGPGTDPVYMPLPVYYSLKASGSYLIFYQNSHPAVFGFGPAKLKKNVRPIPAFPASKQPTGLSPLDDNQSLVYFSGGMLRYYLMPGTPRQALERYTRLTGRPELPPRWSLGYHQSRWGYKNAADIREVVAGFKEHDLPLDAIHLDIDYMQGYRVFTIDPERFPDLPGLAAELKDQGIHLVTIIDPGIKQDRDYDVFREGLQRRLLLNLADDRPAVGQVWPGWVVFPDFSNPEAREWWGAYYARLLDAGVDGFWHDMNEPSCFAAWGDLSLPVSAVHCLEGREGTHAEGHNLYALQMNQAAHTALRKLRPEKRPWLVSRSGWASQQRFAWNWTGDIESSWRAQKMTLATVLGLGMSGIPFSGPDTGGFSGDPSAELYLRAFQASAFMPFFRTHSAASTRRREPWVFGEPTTSILREFLRLRRRLMPFLYTLAWEASQSGQPLVRPLFWIDPQDEALWDVDDAFLLGDSLLVAPVLEEGARQIGVRLPAGCWYDFWSDTVHVGPDDIRADVSLERIPLFVHAGSLLPMEEGHTLALHVYPPQAESLSAAGRPSGRIYCDEGDGYGPWRVDSFTMRREGQALEIEWTGLGELPFPYPSLRLVCHGAQPDRIEIDGEPAFLDQVDRPFHLLRLHGI